MTGVVDSMADVEMDTSLLSEDADDDAAVPFSFSLDFGGSPLFGRGH